MRFSRYGVAERLVGDLGPAPDLERASPELQERRVNEWAGRRPTSPPVIAIASTQRQVDLGGKRLLIFIVAYNAETTIEKVLSRIPPSLRSDEVEVLIIDDSSKDDTFVNGLRYQQRNSAFKITVLRTPENQGYGGNQKLGYRYAIDNGFDIVALVHGDGQYAPEKFPICSRHWRATKPTQSSARA